MSLSVLSPLDATIGLIALDQSPLIRTINQLIERLNLQEQSQKEANERIHQLQEELNQRFGKQSNNASPSSQSIDHDKQSNDQTISQSNNQSTNQSVTDTDSVNQSTNNQSTDDRIKAIEEHLAAIDLKLNQSINQSTSPNEQTNDQSSNSQSNTQLKDATQPATIDQSSNSQSSTQLQDESNGTQPNKQATIESRMNEIESKLESLNMAVANFALIDRPNSQQQPDNRPNTQSNVSDQRINDLVNSALSKQMPSIEKSLVQSLSQNFASAGRPVRQTTSSSISSLTASGQPISTIPPSTGTSQSDSDGHSDTAVDNEANERLQSVEMRLSQLEGSLSQDKQSNDQANNALSTKLGELEQGASVDRAKWNAQLDVLKQTIGQSLKQSQDNAAQLAQLRSRPSSTNGRSSTVSNSQSNDPANNQSNSETNNEAQSEQSDEAQSEDSEQSVNAVDPPDQIGNVSWASTADIEALNEKLALLIAEQHLMGQTAEQSSGAQDVINRNMNQRLQDLDKLLKALTGQLQQSGVSFQLGSPISVRALSTTSDVAAGDNAALTSPSAEQALEAAQSVARQIALLEREFATLSGKVSNLQTSMQSQLNQSANQSTSLNLLSSALAAQSMQSIVTPPAPAADAEAYAHLHYSIKQLRAEQADLASKNMALSTQLAGLQKRDQTINDISTDLRGSVSRVETGLNKKISEASLNSKNALDLTARSLKNDLLDTERRLNDAMNSAVARTDRDLRAHVAASLEPFALASETSAGRLPMSVKCFSCGTGAQTVSGPASLKWIQAHGQGSQPTVLPTTHVNEMRIDKGREMFVGGRDGQLYKGRERGSVAMIKGDEERQQGFNVTYGKLPPVNQAGGGQTARGSLSNRNSLENRAVNQSEEEKEPIDIPLLDDQNTSSFVTEQ